MGAYFLAGAAIIALVALIAAIGSAVLMLAWNASVAIIWGLPTIDFMQALCLYVVVGIIGAAFTSTLSAASK